MKINTILYNFKFFYKIINLCLFIFIFFIIININNSIYAKDNEFIVTLDPGHGGYDNGAVYDTFREKDISLAIALKLGKKIELDQKDVIVVYTRNDDSYLQLFDRSLIANINKSKLLISIHCNASNELSESSLGTETWILGSQFDESKHYNVHLLSKENFVIFLEKMYQNYYNVYNKNVPEDVITMNLVKDAFLENSLRFALIMERTFQDTENRFSRGVKQAPFLILVNTFMPSVLIEVGFLNHPEESYYISSEYGQNKIVNSIYQSFLQYKEEYDERSSVSL